MSSVALVYFYHFLCM